VGVVGNAIDYAPGIGYIVFIKKTDLKITVCLILCLLALPTTVLGSFDAVAERFFVVQATVL